jgi:transcriptional regulator with XRE-family HTH domain
MKVLPVFAARLRELRDAAKLTQHELSERTGLHRQAIAKLETGVTRPTWDTVQVLAAALGVSCEAFRTVDAAEPPAPAKTAGRSAGAKKTRKRKGK